MRVSNRDKANRAHPIMKGWPIRLISTAILACLASSAGHTSDLEIYQAAQGGNASIMMMLDNSGSMGHGTGADSIKDDYNIDPRAVRTCDFFLPFVGCISYSTKYITDDRMETQLLYNDQGVNSGEVSYRVYYRTKNSQSYYDRMSRLKMALIPLLANPKSAQGFGTDVDLTKYKIGLGSFLGSGGNIDAQIADLTFENRKILINFVSIRLRRDTILDHSPTRTESRRWIIAK